MYDGEEDNFYNLRTIDYELFSEKALESKELVVHSPFTLDVCNELTANMCERTLYHDKKLFRRDGNSIKPDEICIVGSKVKYKFEGLIHIHGDYLIDPYNSIKLLAGLEGFLSNSLNTKRVYREKYFSLQVITRNSETVLCIEYKDELQSSFLDKYYCRKTATLLRNIFSNSIYSYSTEI